MPAPPPSPPAQVLVGAALWVDDGVRAGSVDGQALLLEKGRIKALGPEKGILAAHPRARVVRLPGGTLLPGLIEGHAHVAAIGQFRTAADLSGARSLQEALGRLKAWTDSHPEGWIQGWGWDQNLWPGQAYPRAEDLEPLAGNRPAALSRVDGHALWANRAALKAAGITRHTPDPKGGAILRDGSGEPTGILLDAASELLRARIPFPSPAQAEAQLLEGLGHLRRLGFTAVADMGVDAAALAAYRRLDRQGRLPIRVFAYLAHDPALLSRELRKGRRGRLSFFQVQGAKFYLDGALGSRGARLLEPYADAPGLGLWATDPARLASDLAATAKAGYQAAIHAIGDAANREALELLAGSSWSLPPRVEHAQIVREEDARRFGPLGVVASVQPIHCADDHAWTPARLGPGRVKEAFPWRTFIQGGAILALGSDAPLAEANPFLGMAAAETRQDAQGLPQGGFLPEHRLDRAESLRGYTLGNARALGRAGLGVLAPGAAADLLWVQAPVHHMHPRELGRLRPGRLWVNGTEIP
jgi:predicted amidohydrolase YtcJ